LIFQQRALTIGCVDTTLDIPTRTNRGTHMKAKALVLVAACAALAGPLPAIAQYQQGDFYLGAGVTHNRLSGWDNATGYQIFGGFEPRMAFGPLRLGAELGYMDSGDFSQTGQADFAADGVWVSAVGRFPVTPQINALARLGWDFGDDDGFLWGAGLGFRVNPAFEIRGEYVARDNIDSIQANAVIHF
jgi:hypothetical protein